MEKIDTSVTITLRETRKLWIFLKQQVINKNCFGALVVWLKMIFQQLWLSVKDQSPLQFKFIQRCTTWHQMIFKYLLVTHWLSASLQCRDPYTTLSMPIQAYLRMGRFFTLFTHFPKNYVGCMHQEVLPSRLNYSFLHLSSRCNSNSHQKYLSVPPQPQLVKRNMKNDQSKFIHNNTWLVRQSKFQLKITY